MTAPTFIGAVTLELLERRAHCTWTIVGGHPTVRAFRFLVRDGKRIEVCRSFDVSLVALVGVPEPVLGRLEAAKILEELRP